MNKIWLLTGRVAFWLAWPALWLYLRHGERSRLLITNGQGELLVVKGWLSANGKWDLPGGGLHAGEVAAVGACRELREETGLVLEPSQLVDLGGQRVRSKGFKADMRFFGARIKGRPDLRRQPFEIVDVSWVALEGLDPATADSQVLRGLALMAQRQ